MNTATSHNNIYCYFLTSKATAASCISIRADGPVDIYVI